jgi:hypothetical protein
MLNLKNTLVKKQIYHTTEREENSMLTKVGAFLRSFENKVKVHS